MDRQVIKQIEKQIEIITAKANLLKLELSLLEENCSNFNEIAMKILEIHKKIEEMEELEK